MKFSKWPMAVLVALGLLLADQVTKLAVLAWLAPIKRVEVIPGLFDLRFIMNPGVAFGMFAGGPKELRIIGLTVVALVTVGIMIYFLKTARPGEGLFVIGLSLVAGGAIGNVVDRTRLGEVVDFLFFYSGQYYWPAFNVADIGITVGTGLIMIHLWRNRHEIAR